MWLLLSTDHTTDHTGSVVWKTNRWCLATCISGNDNCCLGICEGRKSRNTGSVKCVPSECGHIGGVKAKEDLSMTAASALWRAENLILSYLSNHPCGNGVVRDAITPFSLRWQETTSENTAALIGGCLNLLCCFPHPNTSVLIWWADYRVGDTAVLPLYWARNPKYLNICWYDAYFCISVAVPDVDRWGTYFVPGDVIFRLKEIEWRSFFGWRVMNVICEADLRGGESWGERAFYSSQDQNMEKKHLTAIILYSR